MVRIVLFATRDALIRRTELVPSSTVRDLRFSWEELLLQCNQSFDGYSRLCFDSLPVSCRPMLVSVCLEQSVDSALRFEPLLEEIHLDLFFFQGNCSVDTAAKFFDILLKKRRLILVAVCSRAVEALRTFASNRL